MHSAPALDAFGICGMDVLVVEASKLD